MVEKGGDEGERERERRNERSRGAVVAGEPAFSFVRGGLFLR